MLKSTTTTTANHKIQSDQYNWHYNQLGNWYHNYLENWHNKYLEPRPK